MKQCVLIFDDDSEILFVCKIILENQNYQVETKTFCDNVIDDILRVKPHLVIMDLWIPEIGGEKAVTLMKSNVATQNIPVILFSANTEIEEICNRVHANGFLRKPFELEHFLQIISNNILEIS